MGQNRFWPAEKLADFLLSKTGSVFGYYESRMCAAEQRNLFGVYLGKGVICIDGSSETVSNRVKVCFGLDSEIRGVTRWSALCGGAQ